MQCIYRDLEYATNLIKAKAGKNQTRREAAKGGATAGTGTDGSSGGAGAAPDDDDEEESWTFVGGDAETIDDLSSEAVLKRTVPDLRGLAAAGGGSGSSGRRALGSRVLGAGVKQV